MNIKRFLMNIDRFFTEIIPSIIEKAIFNPELDFSLSEEKESGDSCRYMPSVLISKGLLRRVLNKADIDIKNSSVIDIGCGKGKMIYLFSKWFQFKKVDGVEYDTELVETARNNLKILKCHSTIFEADATCFDKYKDYNVFYLCNPFFGSIFEETIKRINSSIFKSEGRDIYIIYYNPLCHDVLIKMNYNLVYSKSNPYRKITGRVINVYKKC